MSDESLRKLREALDYAELEHFDEAASEEEVVDYVCEKLRWLSISLDEAALGEDF